MEATNTKIEIRGLWKIFGPRSDAACLRAKAGASKQELLEASGHVLALKNIDLNIAAGGIHVIMGLSGSGKSTLVRHINRLVEPTEGQIYIDGEDVLGLDTSALTQLRRHRVSMVFQSFALLPHRNVTENIAYGLAQQGMAKPERETIAAHWTERVGLQGFEASYPRQLSGGMQQRVGLARALATDADILLMDEPFSALDPLIRSDMQKMLLGLQAELNKTIVFITHDLDEALAVGGRVTILDDGEIEQTDDPENIVLFPANNHVAEFVKDINRGRVLKVSAVMEPGAAANDGPEILIATNLEDAARMLSEAGQTSGMVIGMDGQIEGAISLARTIEVMSRARRSNQTS